MRNKVVWDRHYSFNRFTVRNNFLLFFNRFTLLWNAKLTYMQIFIPIFKYFDLGTNNLYLSSNHLYLASNHLYLGTEDLEIGMNDLYLGSNNLYLSSNTTICI